jgi:chloramphenicol-sensitive protein RarD
MAKENKTGIIYTAAAFLSWGILPLYWHFLEHVPALTILAHRIVWSFIFIAILITYNKQWAQVARIIQQGKTILAIIGCSVFISANWFIYIWAVNHGHVIETSLGYYINPLLSITFGMLFLRERLDRWATFALICAASGVLIQIIAFGQVPWVSLSLALSFAIYGLLKKLLQVEAAISLALETLIMLPFAAGFLIYLELAGGESLTQQSTGSVLLLIGSGLVTALPLLWFAQGTNRIKLVTVGFLQYLAPTIGLLLGIFFFHEHFSHADMVSFGFIWLAIVLYSLGQLGGFRRKRVVRG